MDDNTGLLLSLRKVVPEEFYSVSAPEPHRLPLLGVSLLIDPDPFLINVSTIFLLEIQADELQASLAKAGIDLSDADLQQFIKAMDKDGDGAIDYEEWRDFLVVSSLDNLHGTQSTDPAEHSRIDVERKKVAPPYSDFVFGGKFFLLERKEMHQIACTDNGDRYDWRHTSQSSYCVIMMQAKLVMEPSEGHQPRYVILKSEKQEE